MRDEVAPVDLEDPRVLKKWATSLQVDESQVLAAAAKVGHMPAAILFYFKSKSRPLKTIVTAADRAKYEVIKQQRRGKRLSTTLTGA